MCTCASVYDSHTESNDENGIPASTRLLHRFHPPSNALQYKVGKVKRGVGRQAGTTCPLLASRLYPKQRNVSHTVHTLHVASLSLYTFPTVVGEVREATQWKISLLCHADILLFLPPSPSPAYHIVTGTIRNVHISSRTEGK